MIRDAAAVEAAGDGLITMPTAKGGAFYSAARGKPLQDVQQHR